MNHRFVAMLRGLLRCDRRCRPSPARSSFLWAIDPLEDRLFLSSASPAMSPTLDAPSAVVLAQATATVTLTCSSPIQYGQRPTLRAAVTSSTGIIPTGTVSFRDGERPIGTAALSGGIATLAPSGLALGSHSFTAIYNGNASYPPAASAPVVRSVTAATTTTILSSNYSAVAGQAVAFTAIVSTRGPADALPGGSVSFYDGRKLLATVPLVNGVASVATTRLTTRDHYINAVFGGSWPFGSSKSPAITETITYPTVVDLLAVYTPSARSTMGGAAAVQQTITKAVADTNQAFINSQIPVTLRLVYQTEVSYSESGLFDTDLDRLQSKRDGYLDQVHTLRDRYGADLVTLFEDRGDYGGLAYTLTNLYDRYNADRAFSVMLIDQAPAPSYTLAHELGHNFGATHDPQNSNGPGIFSYSYGYRYTVGGTTYHDIMAYDPGITIPYYANPSVSYQGAATGSSQANVALTITKTAPYVAGYRSTVVTSLPPLAAASMSTSAASAVRGQTVTFTTRITSMVSGFTVPSGTLILRDGASILGTATVTNGIATWTGSFAAAGTHTITALFAGGATLGGTLSVPMSYRVYRPTA